MFFKQLEDWKKRKFGRVITEEELARRTSPVWPYVYFDPGRPVDPKTVDDVLKGAIDIHIHGAPLGAWLPGRPPIVNTCIEASYAGMKALVFKDHNTWTNNVAIVVQQMLEILKEEKAKSGEDFTPVEVYGSIVLNETVGGLNPKAVEIALGYGRCKEVWLPSLDAWFQRAAIALAKGQDPYSCREGIKVIDDKGNLLPEVIKILEIIDNYNRNSGDRCAFQTCHVSNEEKFAVLNYVKEAGLDVPVIFTHITQELTLLTPEEAEEAIEKGAYVEFAECSCQPWGGMNDWIVAFDYSINLLKHLLDKYGPDHIILVSDAGQPALSPIIRWKTFIRTLLAKGISERDLNIMLKEVPAKVLGIK